MPNVIKGNRELTVAEEKVDEFLQLGYNLIDSEGKIVQTGNAITLKDVRAENDTLKVKYAELKVKYETLKVEDEALKVEDEALKVENEKIKAENEALKKQKK
jgi:FtsZ-binding cell division protein ZapB